MCNRHKEREVMLRCERKREIWRCLFCGHRTQENGKAPIATRFLPWRWFTELRHRRWAINAYWVVVNN